MLDTGFLHGRFPNRRRVVAIEQGGEMATGVLAQLAFNYESHEIAATEAKQLERHAKVICETQDRVRRVTAEGVLRIGKELAAARDRLANHGNGTFGKWCGERCGISATSAKRAVAAFEQFKDQPTVGQSFDATALYLLSSESCPEEVRDEFLARAEAGERVTAKVVRDELNQDRAEPSYEDRIDRVIGRIRALADSEQRCILLARLRNICEELDHDV